MPLAALPRSGEATESARPGTSRLALWSLPYRSSTNDQVVIVSDTQLVVARGS
ncbi:hypothetical protein [Streptomyces decoyicus]|uniref:hypothetical protein n=1 Tax=Streptomyces decoyicus TaxID=249567 RepID=UPI000B217E04|nr:hypothetical protein [Streptomyces decoyicus]QZY17545.1 hypothetical protein K7C20_21765 [Streptomyces decoyicus]